MCYVMNNSDKFKTNYTRYVRKIRSPRRWSCEEHFTQDLAILVCSIVSPTSNLHSLLRRSVLTGQPFAMELPLASPARCKLRAVIRFLSAKGTTHIDIRQLCKIYGLQSIDCQKCAKVVREFLYGYTNFHDKQRSGRLSVSAKTIAKVELKQEMKIGM